MDAYTLEPNGTKTPVAPANGKDFTLEEMQKHIGGGYVEPLYLDRNTVMMCDEDGLPKRLEANQAASELAGTLIVGKVLVMPRKMLK